MYDGYDAKNDLWGFPQTYKNILFHPIKLKDGKIQSLFYQVFYFPKKYITDVEIVKASYLKYLVFYVQNFINPGGKEIMIRIKEVLSWITKEDVNIFFEELDINASPIDKILTKIKIGNTIFSEKDFDTIREIVLLQNGLSVEYIEDFNPEMEKHLEFINRKFSDLTFEDEIWIFCSLMRKTIFEVQEYTLYQFKKQLERLLLLHNFELYSPLEVSGQISAKDGKSEIVQHYLSHIEKESRYDRIMIKKEVFSENNPKLFDSNFIHNQ